MNYLTNYYKNLSEQLQNKIEVVQRFLSEELAGICGSSTDVSSSFGRDAYRGGELNKELYPPSDSTTLPKSSSYVGGMLASSMNLRPEDTYQEFMNKSFAAARANKQKLSGPVMRDTLFSLSDEDQQKVAKTLPDTFAQDILDAEYEQGKRDLAGGENIRFGPVKTGVLGSLEQKAQAHKEWLNSPWMDPINKKVKIQTFIPDGTFEDAIDPKTGKPMTDASGRVFRKPNYMAINIERAPLASSWLRGTDIENQRLRLGNYIDNLLPRYRVYNKGAWKGGYPDIRGSIDVGEPTADDLTVETQDFDPGTTKDRIKANQRQIDFEIKSLNTKQLEDLDNQLTGRIQGYFKDIGAAKKAAGDLGKVETGMLANLKKEDSIRLQNRIYNELKMRRSIESNRLNREIAADDARRARWGM